MDFLNNLFTTKAIAETDEGFAVTVLANPQHPVYQAHFPGNPITPGACLLQTAVDLLGQKLGKRLFLKSAKNIKFLSVLVPEAGKEVKFAFSHIVDNEQDGKAQVVISGGEAVYAKMSLVFCYGQL